MGNDGLRQNVVSLVDRLVEMAFPEIGRLQAYWQELRGNRIVPLRSEVDPRAIESSLEYAFILERIAPGLARFRLAGTHINDLVGMEVRGMPISAIFGAAARDQLSIVIEQVFSEPAVAVLETNAEQGVGRPGLDGRLLLLPLKSDFGDVSRILGCFVTRGPIGRTPRRFAIQRAEAVPAASFTVDSGQPASAPTGAPDIAALEIPDMPSDLAQSTQRDRGAIDPTPNLQSIDGFSEAQSQFTPAPRPERRQKPKLYVIRDNDAD